jgi:hypothetical protein
MHDRPSDVGAWLRKVVNGYYQYHAVPGNTRQLSTFRQRINRLWYQALARRSQRARRRWETLTPLFERWIPRPKVLHPYPQVRFYARATRATRIEKRRHCDAFVCSLSMGFLLKLLSVGYPGASLPKRAVRTLQKGSFISCTNEDRFRSQGIYFSL